MHSAQTCQGLYCMLILIDTVILWEKGDGPDQTVKLHKLIWALFVTYISEIFLCGAACVVWNTLI